MRGFVLVGGLAVALLAAFGAGRAVAQDATPGADEDATTMTLVERAERVSRVDLGEPGPTPGDLTVWGPNPLYDEANAADTGATTRGSCQALNAAGDNHCIETIVFEDGSTLEIQGVQLAAGAPSTTTIVGGSGRYLDASGTLLVDASDDLFLWTKTLQIAR